MRQAEAVTPSPPAGTSPGPSWQPVFDGLHDAIIRHHLDPGAKLVEDEIAAVFAVSRTIVRSALQALARDGIVVLERHKGASVARPSPREAREIFEARELIEPRIAALAAARLTAGGADRLHACLDAEHAALQADNPREAVYQSAAFHRTLAALAGQSVLAAVLDDLLSRSSLVIALYWKQPDAICESRAHRRIVDALADGNGARAATLMRRHIAALLAALDLSERQPPRSNLAEAIGQGR